ncbi:MAG: tetratricopeptide repeat protein [Armatimonadota bacterium]
MTRAESAASSEGVEALLAEANLFRTRGQFDEAVSACMRVLQRDAANAAAHSLIANVYRDQGNYREALNWFKLAVELNPDNESDRKKLDEMIDRVFQGVLAGEIRSGVKAAAQPPAAGFAPMASGRRKPGFTGILARIQPVYVAVAFAFLITGAFIWISIHLTTARLQVAGKPGRQAANRTSSRGETPENTTANSNATAVNVAANPPQVSPPPPDAVEGPNGLKPIPGLPGIYVKQGGNLAAPSNPKPAANDAGSDNPKPPTDDAGSPPTEVPPLSPLSADSANADTIELQTKLLKMTLDGTVASSKLPSKVDTVTIDPRTNALTIRYTVPRMETPGATKQGLLYTGFHLVWAAAEQAAGQRKSFSGFTLIGNAYSDTERANSLALMADVTPQQADAARNAAEYKTVLQFLTKPWWRSDLEEAEM